MRRLTAGISVRTVLVLVVILPLGVYAGQAILPHAFQAGQPAKASQVNENFQALASAINDNDARIARLEAALKISSGSGAGSTLDLGTGGQLKVGQATMVEDDLRYLVGIRLKDGSSAEAAAVDCKDLRVRHPKLLSGPYWIAPGGGAAVPTYCEMAMDNGGWTFVVRIDGGSSVPSNMFQDPHGSYPPNLIDDGKHFSLGALDAIYHTELMITIDTADASVAASNRKLVFFGYSQGHPYFTAGPLPCYGGNDRPFGWKTNPGDPYAQGGGFGCHGTAWAPFRSGDRLALPDFFPGGPGVLWARGIDGDDSRGHDAWIYAR